MWWRSVRGNGGLYGRGWCLLAGLLWVAAAGSARAGFTYVTASAEGHVDYGATDFDGDQASGFGPRQVDAEAHGAVKGSARAAADPVTGDLKVEASGYDFATDLIHKPIWNDQSFVPATLYAAGASAYLRTVYEVTALEGSGLQVGDPVDLVLSVALNGRLEGDPDTDGIAQAKIQSWVYLADDPLIASALGDLVTGDVPDPLSAEYPMIQTWYLDRGVLPTLELAASNQATGSRDVDLADEATTASDDGGGGDAGEEGTLSGAIPIGGEGGLGGPVQVPLAHVGDWVVIETTLQAYAEVVNDEGGTEAAIGLIPPDVSADFYHTGHAWLNTTTEGALLVPLGESLQDDGSAATVPAPPVWGLVALGCLAVGRMRRRGGVA